MSRVRGRDTRPERAVGEALRRRGLRFRTHDRALPGRPDIVFSRRRVAVFIDGDFWHGFRYPSWTFHLAPFWRRKIEGNRARDRANFAKLRRAGWRVIRIWQHQVKGDLDGCIDRIHSELVGRKGRAPETRK